MTESNKSLNQIIKFRLDKLNKVYDHGVDPYPQKFEPKHNNNEIVCDFINFENKAVTIAGRIMSMRAMGNASFFTIQDYKGRMQIFLKKDNVGEKKYDLFKLLDIGDFIGIDGIVFKTKVGEVTVRANDFTILSKSIRPLPVVKEKDGQVYDAFNNKEQRYRKRYLDLIINPEVKEIFVKRSLIIKTIRDFLDSRNFLEVETPVLQPLYGGANARPFVTHHNALDQKLFLRIADELYLKRLIIGGFERVYEISKDFRNEGMDRNHNPEFTMLEFYWAYADYEDNMLIVEEMIKEVAKKISVKKIKWGKSLIDITKPFKKRPIMQLLSDAVGEDVSQKDESSLKKICDRRNIDTDNKNYGQLIDEMMSELVEPNLIEPTFVIDYPKAISPLAKKHRNNDPDLVERFELFIGGAEFANAFSELNDPVDQRARFESQEKLSQFGDEEAHPIDEDFLQAVEHGMPPTGGVGIGIDRLVMLLTGCTNIKDVILFPAMRTEEKKNKLNLSFRIAFQFIFSNYKNNFTKTASLLSIIGLSFGVSSLLITFFILNGFENVISEKITNFDGHIQIKHFFNKPFTDSQIIADSLEAKFKDRILIDSFKREPAIIRSKNKNDGVIIVGLNRVNSFPFNDFLTEGKSDLINKNIIISHSLAKALNLTVGSDVVIMNTGSIQFKKNKIEKFFVSGIFNSGFSEYDESIVFVNINQLLQFVNEANTIDGLNVRIKNPKDIDELTQYLDLNLLYPLNYITWKDKNSSLYKWIKVQKLPILLIFGIIAFVSLVNIISGTSMTIIDKAGQIGLLLSLGMRKIVLKKYLFITG